MGTSPEHPCTKMIVAETSKYVKVNEWLSLSDKCDLAPARDKYQLELLLYDNGLIQLCAISFSLSDLKFTISTC